MNTHDNQMPTPVLISIKICTQCRLRTQKLLMLDQNSIHSPGTDGKTDSQ